MDFATALRALRAKAGLSIKKLAPELGVDYSYLSKLEANKIRPSEQLVHRVAAYFDYDEDLLLLAAEKIPADIRRILREHPEEAVRFLRKQFSENDPNRPQA